MKEQLENVLILAGVWKKKTNNEMIITENHNHKIHNNDEEYDVILLQLINQMEIWLGIKTIDIVPNNDNGKQLQNSNDNEMIIDEQQPQEQEQEQEQQEIVDDGTPAIIDNSHSGIIDITVEDCLPLSYEFYDSFSLLLQRVWTNYSSNTNPNIHDFNDDNSSWMNKNTNWLIELSNQSRDSKDIETRKRTSNNNVTLENAYHCIRVTKWLRHFMEYNLSTKENTTMLYDNEETQDQQQQQYNDNDSTISHILLLGNNDDDDDSKNKSSFLLLKSLFDHMDQLSNIQGQIYIYVQYIQKKQSTKQLSYLLQQQQQQQGVVGMGDVTAVVSDKTIIVSDDSLEELSSQEILIKLQDEWTQHIETLEYIIVEWYRIGTTNHRKYIRKLLGIYWMKFILAMQQQPQHNGGVAFNKRENTTAAGIKMSLLVLQKILLGIKATSLTSSSSVAMTVNHTSHNDDNLLTSHDDTSTSITSITSINVVEHLLYHILIPLHKVDGYVLWRDQMSMLELYHEALTQCIAIILQLPTDNTKNHNPISFISSTIIALLQPSIFPLAGNTPKQVLLLHEIDTYIHILVQVSTSLQHHEINRHTNHNINNMMKTLFMTLARCISSDHSRVSERALQFFKNKHFLELIKDIQQQSEQLHLLRIILPSLIRKEPSWNPTVRKMTYNVLKHLQEIINEETFVFICNELFSNNDNNNTSAFVANREVNIKVEQEKQQQQHVISKKGILTSSTIAKEDEKDNIANTSQFSLKAGMGSWRPPSSTSSPSMAPPSNRKGSKLNQPPGKGKAPWANSPTSSSSQQPPLTVTGVAPWAMTSSSTTKKSSQQQQQPPLTVTGIAPWATTASSSVTNTKKSTSSSPPVTVTGIAPWSITGKTSDNASSSSLSSLNATGASSLLPPTGQKRMRPPINHSLQVVEDDGDDDGDGDGDNISGDIEMDNIHQDKEDNANEMESNMSTSLQATNITEPPPSSSSGMRYFLEYMDTIKPPEEDNGLSTWSKLQMEPTPTYLSDLKFHDLVFGHELGAGAFGCVKYARHINKTKSRSQWAEYAVKIVSTDKIRLMGYEASIQREIATLHILSHHPGIARLVSSFRFREGAYLVLEYASKGDLHTLLQQHGSLDTDSTRFVIGEVIAALASIHDMGFVYGDLKPENIVITESGHIKLTDFGGCRPLTYEAKEKVKAVSKGLLRNLRDGDWKTNKNSVHDKNEGKDIETDDLDDVEFQEYYEENEEDLRIEGTTAYLPPEVVMGSIPNIAADSWALGCVFYYCLAGKPPLLAANDEATKKRIVTFDIGNSSSNDSPSTEENDDFIYLFRGKYATVIIPDAQSAICVLLNRDYTKRPTMQEIAEHDFFINDNVDVFTLYNKPAYPIDVGSVVSSPEHAQWSRRQFSSIWAPQPVAYDITFSSTSNKNKVSLFDSIRNNDKNKPILEGEERTGFFSSSGTYSSIDDKKKKMLLPPS